MKKKRITIILLQLLITTASVGMLLSYSNKKLSPTDVYVYERNFESVGEVIEKGDVKKVKIPASSVTKGFARKEKDIIGKSLDGKAMRGQYVYSDSLVDKEEINIFETMDLSKYRKISLPIDFVDGLSGNIKKGDKVDLVYTGENKDNGETVYSKAFLQDVLVYSINTEDGFKFIDRSNYYPGEAGEEEIAEAQTLGIITLAVTLEEAEQIEARVASGTVRFASRFEDSETYETLGFSVDNLDYKQSVGTGATNDGSVVGGPVEGPTKDTTEKVKKE